MLKNQPIGFFDSGAGGLSVLKDAIAALPYENYIYYADNKNAPYGNLATEDIRALSFIAVNELLKCGIKALVIACNTATAAAVREIRENIGIPVVGMEPAVKPALEKGGTIIVAATESTLKNRRYNVPGVIPVPMPGLAALIENSYDDDLCIAACIKESLKDVNTSGANGFVLGCTHYVLKKHIFADLFPDATIFDGNCGTVNNLKRILTAEKKLNCGEGCGIKLKLTDDTLSKREFYGRILQS